MTKCPRLRHGREIWLEGIPANAGSLELPRVLKPACEERPEKEEERRTHAPNCAGIKQHLAEHHYEDEHRN